MVRKIARVRKKSWWKGSREWWESSVSGWSFKLSAMSGRLELVLVLTSTQLAHLSVPRSAASTWTTVATRTSVVRLVVWFWFAKAGVIAIAGMSKARSITLIWNVVDAWSIREAGIF
jgi:hypothetical protein